MKLSIISTLCLIWCLNTKNVLCQTVDQDTNQVTSGLSSFAIEMLAKTTVEGGDDLNIIMSTYSIWNLLAILNEGASGATQNQIQSVLRLPRNSNQFRVGYKNIGSALTSRAAGVEINTAAAIFTDRKKPLLKKFQNTLSSQYKVDVTPINFADTRRTAKYIDNYIANATNNRLKHFINYDDLVGAQMLLTTAIFFKGAWSTPFNRTATKPAPFFNENNRQIGTVQMMYQTDTFPYKLFDTLQAAAVELPYGTEKRYAMIVMLPLEGTKLSTMLQRLEAMPFRNIMDELEESALEFEDEVTHVYLPRFKYGSDFVLNVILEQMGMRDVFDPVYANLLGISPENFYLSRVIHKAEIEVTEEGTVASAASAGTLEYKIPPPVFNANRPFVYFIVEKTTKTMLFAGKVSNPREI